MLLHLLDSHAGRKYDQMQEEGVSERVRKLRKSQAKKFTWTYPSPPLLLKDIAALFVFAALPLVASDVLACPKSEKRKQRMVIEKEDWRRGRKK